jgi:hypothetical protein
MGQTVRSHFTIVRFCIGAFRLLQYSSPFLHRILESLTNLLQFLQRAGNWGLVTPEEAVPN